MFEIEEIAESLPFWNRLSDSEKSITVNSSFLRSYEKDEILFGQGGSCLGMVHVISGKIRASVISEEGREITLFRVCENENCVLSASCVISQLTFDTVITAEENTEVMILPSTAFAKLTEENIYVKCFMYEVISERFSSVMWVMQAIIFQRFDKRLARFLVEYFDRTDEKEIRMTQEAIAKEVNSAREVIARMLRQFSNDGLVVLKREKIILKNIEGLKNIYF